MAPGFARVQPDSTNAAEYRIAREFGNDSQMPDGVIQHSRVNGFTRASGAATVCFPSPADQDFVVPRTHRHTSFCVGWNVNLKILLPAPELVSHSGSSTGY